MTDLELATSFRAAADLLQKEGWIQGSLGGEWGQGVLRSAAGRCLLGALRDTRAYGRAWGKKEVVRALGFELVPGARYEANVAIWNDAPGRTAAEVIDRLESIALALEIRALAADWKAGLWREPSEAELGVAVPA